MKLPKYIEMLCQFISTQSNVFKFRILGFKNLIDNPQAERLIYFTQYTPEVCVLYVIIPSVPVDQNKNVFLSFLVLYPIFFHLWLKDQIFVILMVMIQKVRETGKKMITRPLVILVMLSSNVYCTRTHVHTCWQPTIQCADWNCLLQYIFKNGLLSFLHLACVLPSSSAIGCWCQGMTLLWCGRELFVFLFL